MTERTPRARWARIGLFAALGLGAAVAAAFAPAPDRPLQLPGESAAAGQEHASGAEVLAPTPDRPGVMLPAPSDTPPAAPTFTDAPRLLAAKAVRAMLADQYPPLLREAGIGGSATVWIHVGATGAIEDARLDASSGYDALDQAALRVASGLRFRPALDGNDAVAIWLPLRVVFGAGDGLRLEDSRGVDLTDPALQEPPDAREAIREMQVEDARVRERLEELAARARAEAPDTPRVPPMAGPTPQERLERLRAGPQFTPFSTPPTLRNRSEVSGLLETYYPPLLKDAGIQGGADVWLFIDADGTVLKAQLNASSGYQALDEAAVRVAHEMAFDPALNRDDPVPVWVSLKIEFKNR